MYDTVRRNILTLLSVTILITAGTHANSTTTPHRTTDYLVSTTSNINYTEPSSNNEEPSTWYISERDDLRDILSQDVYQEYQWSLLEGFYTLSEWSYWTYCVACLSNGMEGSVQLRHRAGIEPSVEARNCTQDQPLCPDITYRGLWYYNKVVGNFLSEVFPEPPIYYPFSTNEAMEDEEAIAELEKRYHLYRLRYCSQKIKESGGAKYIAMTSEGCYGSNYSDIFNYGVDTRTYSSLNLANRMQVYIYSDCPNYCRQVEESGLCLCYFYVTPPVYALSTASQTDAISMCAHENSIILPLNYSQYAVTFIDALLPGRIWLSSGPRDELSYTCRDFTENQTIVESDECNPNDTYQVLCLYNDAVQYEWTFWTPWSSCSSACGGGFRDQRRYRLAPESPGESVVYSPLNEGDYSTCNDDVCPWYNSTNHTVANLYPKWAGCWLSNNVKSIFTMYEDEMILDGDKFNRREFVEKCAIATQGVGNVYAVRMRLCYVGNISSAYDYNSTGASDLCDRHGRTSGRGYDIYFHSNATADPQWGKYFTAENVLGSCSLACGGGFKTEIRSCNNPPPTDPGTSCPGAISREVNCNTEPCPEAPFGYSNLGCYHAEVTNVVIHYLLDGAVPGLRRDAVRKCALVANSEGALVFGVVQLGHCVLSSNLHCEYSSHNVSSQCFQGMGSSTSISMYALHDENGTIPLSYDNICPGGSDKSATTEAPDPVTEELEKQVAEILELDSISPEQTSEALATLEDIISNQDLTPQSVKATTDLLTALADRLTFEPSDHSGSANSTAAVLNEVVKIIDILTQDGQQEAWAESQKFTSLLTSIESIALKSAAIAHSGGTSRVAISIQLLNPSEYTSTGYSHTGDSVGVYLPPEVFSHQNTSSDGGQVVSMVTVSYTDVSEFIGEPVIDEEKLESNIYNSSRMSQTVISLKLGSLSSDTRLQDDIRISIPIDLSENETYAKDRSLVCVFWNDSLGLWSDDGCTTRIAVDNTSVDCHCNHLTSFGVLMKFTDYEVSENNEKWLKHIFYIGCGISLFCLITTFIIFVYLDNLKTERKKIHMNLIVALCLAQITHVVGIGLTSDAATCTTIAVLLHFLYTATFTWMLCEGIHLYHKVIAVFETEGASKRILYYVIGWGVPVIIVAISVGIRHDGYGRDDFCWLSITDVEGNHDGLIWAFIGPVCLVILINFGIMVAVMRVVVRSAVSVVPREKRNLQTVKAGVKSVLILTPILGVNWVLGLLAVNEKLAVFEFLFVIINSLQGLLIFIFHCVGSSEVRSALKRKRDQSSRSLEPSSDDKNRKKSRLKVSNWFSKNSDTKNWPPNIFHRPSSGSVSPEPVSRDIIEGLVDGRLGRNVGGLRHMVESPPTPNLLHVSRGKVNGAYQREDSTLSNLSAKHVWQAPPQHTSYSGASTKFSISTVTTSLGDGSDSGSRRSSGSGEGSQHDFSNSSLCSDLHDQISQHKNSAQPSSIHKYQAHHSLNDQKNGMYDELGDINELQDIEDYET